MTSAIKASDDPSVKFSIALGLLVTLLCALLLFFWRASLLDDPDIWWHIKVGADIWHNHEFPTRDTYSHTFYGQPWIAKEWLSQIILFFSFSAGGLNAVAFVAAGSVCLATFIFYQYLASHLRPLAAAVVTIAVLFLSSPTFLARPHIFTLPLIVIWTYRLFEAAGNGRAPPYWILAILILWANLHASFTLGFIIAFFAFIDFTERTRLADKTVSAKWVLFLGLGPIATLIHPYLYQAALATLNVSNANEAVPFISEWQPFNARDYRIYEIALLAMLYALMTARLRLPLAKSLLLVFTLHMFLVHVRFAYAFFLLSPLIIAGEVAAQFPVLSAGFWKTCRRDPLEKSLAKSFRPVIAAMVLTSTTLAFLFLKADIKPDEKVSAANAIAFAKQHQIAGNVLNSYDFGGSLIFNGIKTYVDGRTDQLFLNGFTDTDKKTEKPGNEKMFLQVLERYNIKWSLLRMGDPRIYLLDDLKNWQRYYEDKFAVIHVNTTDRPQDLDSVPGSGTGN